MTPEGLTAYGTCFQGTRLGSFVIIILSLVSRAIKVFLPHALASLASSVCDLPRPHLSSVNDRLDRNQGGHGHAQKTVHTLSRFRIGSIRA